MGISDGTSTGCVVCSIKIALIGILMSKKRSISIEKNFSRLEGGIDE